MADDTEIITKPDPEHGPASGDSQFMAISVRGWLVLIITLTVCTMSGLDRTINEPLYGGFYLAIGYYFGKSDKGKITSV